MNVVTFQKHLNAEDNTRKFLSLHLRDCSIKNGRIGLKNRLKVGKYIVQN